MAQSTVALLCLGSLLACEDAVVVPNNHPASPFALSAPPIGVPPIQLIDVKTAKPSLAKERSQSTRRHESPTDGDSKRHRQRSSSEHQPSSTNGGAAHHPRPH
jgi:hypothetical protein